MGSAKRKAISFLTKTKAQRSKYATSEWNAPVFSFGIPTGKPYRGAGTRKTLISNAPLTLWILGASRIKAIILPK